MKKILLALLFLASILKAQEAKVISPGSNLIIDGIPSIPASIATDVKRYSESRSASLVSWHPTKLEMIISTRFANTAQLHYVKFPLGDRKQITFFEEPVTNASFEPLNGNYFIFGKDQGGNEFNQLYRYDVNTGKSTLLTDGKRSQNGGINWNHKGDKIAYGSTKRNGADRDIYIMDPLNPSTDKLCLELKGGGWGVSDWSADDKQLIVREGISANESHLWIADVATGKLTELTDKNEKNVSYGSSEFSKDGKGVWIITDKESEFSRLAYIDISTKKITYITNDIKWDIEGFAITDDGSSMVFSTNEGGQSQLYFMNPTTRTYKVVKSIPICTINGFQFHKKTNDLALVISTALSASDIFVIKKGTETLERWTESELGGLIPTELTIPKSIVWKSFDGREINGFYYPANKKFEGRRPIIINIHGGPESQSRPGFSGVSNYYNNELGVAVIYPNVRGSSGYGKTFLALDNGFKREESVKDIGALLDWIAQQPELDANRIMVMGGSYGGYMTLAVSTNYVDRIRCAIDVVGISNFNTFLKNTESYRRDLRRVEYGDERDSSMYAFLEKISPLNNANKIKKPLFIVQGGNDPRVPKTEAVQMAEKVKSLGGKVWYLEATDEGHGFKKKNNSDFQLYATVMFIKMYLLD